MSIILGIQTSLRGKFKNRELSRTGPAFLVTPRL